MPLVALPGHFDGEKVRLDEPFDMAPGTRVIVTVLRDVEPDDDRAAWMLLSREGLAMAYADDEPDYSPELVREGNPEYEGR